MKYQIVTREMLERVANFGGPSNVEESKDGTARRFAASPGAAETTREFAEVIRLLGEKLSITVGEPKPYQDGFMYPPSACPLNSDHTGTSVAFFDFPNRKQPVWGFKCHHESCEGKGRRDVEALLGIERPKKQRSGSRAVSQASELIRIATESELYHTPTGTPYARTLINGHYEDWPTDSKEFRKSLQRAYYRLHGSAPGSQATRDAIATIESIACFDGAEYAVCTRVAGDDSCIYLDLCNKDRDVVKITAGEWSQVSDQPVRFRRPDGMLALPAPVKGSRWDVIKPFINAAKDADYSLILSWLVSALRPNRPYPILYFLGEQGSAKSTTTRVVRKIVDPYESLLQALPHDERDLFVAAMDCRVLAYDNVSKIAPWLSDALCRLATGGGLTTRALYTNSDVFRFSAMRPIVMNGIAQAASHGDFLERSILLEAEAIEARSRKDEALFWRDFDAAWPKILGVVLDGVSSALFRMPTTTMLEKPRMADFALFSVAAEDGLKFPEGTFDNAYAANRRAAVIETIDSLPIGPYVMKLANTDRKWEGTFTMLLDKLNDMRETDNKPPKDWPDTARKLSADMTRLKPALRAEGIIYTASKPDRRSRIRTVTISSSSLNTSSTSATSAGPASSTTCAADVGTDGRVETSTNTSAEPEGPSPTDIERMLGMGHQR